MAPAAPRDGPNRSRDHAHGSRRDGHPQLTVELSALTGEAAEGRYATPEIATAPCSCSGLGSLGGAVAAAQGPDGRRGGDDSGSEEERCQRRRRRWWWAGVAWPLSAFLEARLPPRLASPFASRLASLPSGRRQFVAHRLTALLEGLVEARLSWCKGRSYPG